MEAKAMVKQWNQMRAQIIQAQVAPALVLIAIVVLATIGAFEGASDGAKYLAIGVAAATGAVAKTGHRREGGGKSAQNPTALSKKIADSRGLLSLSAIAIVGLDIAIFALVVWAVLG